MMRLAAERKGQAIVELALLLTFLLLLAAGAIQFGTLHGIKLRVEHAAREGARYGSIHALNGTDQDIRTHVIEAGKDLTPPISADNITIATPDGRIADKPIAVTVVYPYSPTVFLVGALLPSTMNIQSTAQMRIEG
jgi:hypothetical protein